MIAKIKRSENLNLWQTLSSFQSCLDLSEMKTTYKSNLSFFGP